MGHIQSLPAGTELVADFEIGNVLGAGGFGITYFAREIALDRKVTIKEYFPADFAARRTDVSATPRSEGCAEDYQWGLDRFIEEAQTLAKFDHTNIVRVYRYFRANNTGYMVLHFEEGLSLKSWLQSLGRAPRQAELDDMLGPLLDALAVVHGADFLHRDIAPDNIIIRTDGSPVLIDFGAARGDIAQHSRTVSALVKPGYSPYEQYGEIGRSQGPWTDIYALAATLYHAITGKRPPDAPSRVVNDEIRPARDAALSAYRSSFLDAIDRGLRIDIEKRPQTVAEWRGLLLAPDDGAKQRGWFSGRRAEKTVLLVDELEADGVGATRALPGQAVAKGRSIRGRLRDEGLASTAGALDKGMLPPPPDVPFQQTDPVRRGRIVDFLDGVRASPRGPTVVAPPDDKHVELGGPAMDASVPGVQAPDTAADGAPPARAAGFFGFGGKAPAPDEKARAVRVQDRPVEIQSAPNVVAAPERKRGRKRKPPRPRAQRTKSRWRFVPIMTKLAVGVVLATFLVRMQQTLPYFEFSSIGTVASSPSAVPSGVVTGSLATRDARASTPPPVPNTRPEAAPSLRATSADTMIRSAPVKRAPATLLLKTFNAHVGRATAVQFVDGGASLVTVGGDGTLKLWDTSSYELIRTLELEHGPAFSLAVQGRRALTGHENGRIALWDLKLGMQLKTFKRNDAPISSLAFAGSDRFLAGSNDWAVSYWEISTPSLPLHVFQGHSRDVLAVAYEPVQGQIASVSADQTVKLWDGKSLSLLRTYPKARNFITSVAFSPDGGALLVGTLSGRISLYSTSSRSRKRRYRGHNGRITSLSFMDGGREFVSASADGTIRLWNRRVSRPLQTFGSAGARISNAAISPDGRLIATAKSNGTVQVWNGVVLD